MCPDEIIAFQWLFAGILILTGAIVGNTFWGFFK